MEKIRGDEAGGRDVFGQRHGEGKGRGAQGGCWRGRVAQGRGVLGREGSELITSIEKSDKIR